MNPLAFERRVAEYGGVLTTEEATRVARQILLTRAANDGMRDDWQLRQRARNVYTEEQLTQTLATVPVARRALLDARIRPYTSIGRSLAEIGWAAPF
jgi:hypothetical protein